MVAKLSFTPSKPGLTWSAGLGNKGKKWGYASGPWLVHIFSAISAKARHQQNNSKIWNHGPCQYWLTGCVNLYHLCTAKLVHRFLEVCNCQGKHSLWFQLLKRFETWQIHLQSRRAMEWSLCGEPPAHTHSSQANVGMLGHAGHATIIHPHTDGWQNIQAQLQYTRSLVWWGFVTGVHAFSLRNWKHKHVLHFPEAGNMNRWRLKLLVTRAKQG